MRTSCNGCRVLRKGCSDDCIIRPCLNWIKSPEAQANATVFLAKFYGRAGLLNLLNAGPEHLRPSIFQSLLYEACGRVVDPVYGSVGLLYSGQWHHCQVAVDSVLKGLPIIQLPNTPPQQIIIPPLKLYDIRHMSKDTAPFHVPNFPQKARTRTRFRRPFRPEGDTDRQSSNGGDELSNGNESMFSTETKEEKEAMPTGEGEMRLELTLGCTYDKYGQMPY